MDSSQKVCPSCKHQIQADAVFCAYCGARFSVIYKGYCATCHAVKEIDSQDRCVTCGGAVIDRHAESSYVSGGSADTSGSERLPNEIASGRGTPVIRDADSSKKKGQAKGCLGCFRIALALMILLLAFLIISKDARDGLTDFLRRSGVDAFLEEKIPTANALVSDDETPTKAVLSPTPVDTSTPRPTPTPDIDLPDLGPNALCFGSYSYGMNCLDDTGWISDGFLRLQYNNTTDMLLCHEKVLVFDSGDILSYDGSRWDEFRPKGSAFSRIGCGANSHLWSVDSDGARFFDGQTWTEYVFTEIFPGKSFSTIADAVASSDDELWAVIDEKILHNKGSQWTLFESESGLNKAYNLNGIALDSEGIPWVSHDNGLLVHDGTTWKEISAPSSLEINTLLIGPDDLIWVGTDSGVSTYQKQGQWLHYPVGNFGGAVSSLALDGQGRLWAGTNWGLGVLVNKQWSFYHMSDSLMTMNSIGPVVVSGNGPQLPEPEQRTPGGLSGTILDNDSPLVNAKVEVCVKPLGLMFSGATPCTGQPFMRTTATDESGQFLFEDLPPAYYTITFQTPDQKWKVYSAMLTLGSKQVRVYPGETTTTEPMDISK